MGGEFWEGEGEGVGGGEEGKCVDCVARQAGHSSLEVLLSMSEMIQL